MSDKPYDPTLKMLVEVGKEDWPVLLGEPRAPVEVIDADIATVSGAADKVLRVRSNPDYLLHLEFHSGHDGAELPPLLHARNALLGKRHGLPVESAVIILKREADSPQLSGVLARTLPHRKRPYLTFEYEVRRVWELDPELLLRGLGTLPLAPISNVTQDQVPGIITRMGQRLRRKISDERRREMWNATAILLGLRYSNDIVQQLLQGVQGMEESSTYQAILAQGEQRGELQGLRRAIVRQARPAFGEPSPEVQAALDAIADESSLLAIIDRVPAASDWYNLLGITPPKPRKKRS